MSASLASDLALRPMTQADLERAVELSRDHSWPHREEDWAFFLARGEGLVAVLDGRVIGTIMAWRYGDHAATLGMVIVDKALQGQGLGRKLMQAMLDQLGERSVILQATAEGAPLYEKLGFVDAGSVHQHQGVITSVPLAELQSGERIRPLGAQDNSPAQLYSRASGMDRNALVEAILAQDSAVVLTRDHTPVGFAALRRFGRGWSIAPIIAPDADGAKALILHWLGQNAGNFTRLDVTDDSTLSPWLAELGLPNVGTVRTMVRGPLPDTVPDASVFGLTSQALG
jgi:predicted N-acetyltransferase YhbS